MFKFNVSEEIIFNIKNKDLKNKLFSYDDNYLVDKFLNKIYKEKILIVYGFENPIRDEICLEIIHRLTRDNYSDYDLNVFKVSCIDDLDEVYLEDKFQIFYLNDFFGKIESKIFKFKNYLDRIVSLENKFLVVNMREFVKNKISDSHFCENLNDYKEDILNILGENYKMPHTHNEFEYVYSKLFYIDKFILFSVLFDNVDNIDLWFKIVKNYFLGKRILREHKDFNELLLESFKKLENSFIFMCSDGKFHIKNLVIEDFLLIKLKSEINIIKDLLNNINSYSCLKNFVRILKSLNIRINYTIDEYEKDLKSNLFEIICSNNIKDIIGVLKFTLELFDIIGVRDFSIIENLNTKIIYSDVYIDGALNYFHFIKNYRDVLIENEIFKSKLSKLVYNQNSLRDFEFYNYNFKYFLFVSEFYSLYDSIDDEEFLDIKKNFDRLINIILNNINSYFTLEYFSFNNEIKQALIDLKFLIDNFNVENIFFKNVYEIFSNVKYKLMELFNNAANFIPQTKEEYHTLMYFENELERSKEFVELTFENINLESVFKEIRENICRFEA